MFGMRTCQSESAPSLVSAGSRSNRASSEVGIDLVPWSVGEGYDVVTVGAEDRPLVDAVGDDVGASSATLRSTHVQDLRSRRQSLTASTPASMRRRANVSAMSAMSAADE